MKAGLEMKVLNKCMGVRENGKIVEVELWKNKKVKMKTIELSQMKSIL
jgi:hypothetical protein